MFSFELLIAFELGEILKEVTNTNFLCRFNHKHRLLLNTSVYQFMIYRTPEIPYF